MPRPSSADRGGLGSVAVIAALAFAVRVWVSWRTHVPDWDGVHYLWAAERAAHGDLGALFGSVFHPGFPAVVAAVLAVAPGVEPQAAAQGVGAVGGAVAAALVFALTDRLWGRGAAWAAGGLFALGTWFVRPVADVLSEGVFLPLVLLGVAGLVRPRVGTARALAVGVCGALAYAVRPEGAVLPALAALWLFARGERRAAWTLGLAAAIGAFAVIAGWATWGPGWVLSSKLTFVVDEGVGRGGLAHYASEFVRMPAALFEALGVALPLAVWGWLRRGPVEGPKPSVVWLLVLPLAVQCLVAPALKSHFRFFVGFGVLLLPLAGAGLVDIVRRAARGRRPFAVALLALVFVPEVVRAVGERRADRVVERDLGAWLAAQGVGERELFTDMPRVAYYAGLEPGPPRRWRPGEAERILDAEPIGWIAVVTERSPAVAELAAARGFGRSAPAEPLASALAERGITVLSR